MNNVQKQVLIIGAFRFPNGDAAAARVLGIGKSLRQAGYEVIFAGWEQSGRPIDEDSAGIFNYEGFKYVSQGEFRTTNLSPFRRLIRYLRAGSNTLIWLKTRPLNAAHTIIVYSGGSLFLLRLTAFCKLRGIRLLADCTEWYDAEGLVGGRLGVAHLDNEFRMRIVNRLIGRMIVISRYLQDYYNQRKCEVLRVPPTIDLLDCKWPITAGTRSNSALNLVYAGIPGKKDLLSPVLHGVRTLRSEGVSIVLNLLGPSRTDLLTCVGGDVNLINELESALIFHGRVAQDAVPSIVARSDFSILIRPEKRVSAAGFSTKLVESLAAGVPVIANRTGDIEWYVRDGKEGILLADTSVDAFVTGIRRILAMSGQELISMREAARCCAEQSFTFGGYVDALDEFITR